MASFLDGGGDAATVIAQMDWSATPLGALDLWPVSLKTAVGMMVASRFPKAIFWGPDHIMLHNDAFRVIMGNKPAGMGQPMAVVWAEAWDELRDIAAQALQGHATFIENFPLTIHRGGSPELCHFTFCYSPIRDEHGSIGGFIDTVMETTATVRADHLLKLRNAELSHRIQNTLSVVSSIARQTLKNADTPDGAWTVLSARLRALSETHNLLRAGANARTDAAEIVRTTLRPHATDETRFDIHGPAVGLPEHQALALTLAVNELATNAIKHGALSVPGGRVGITWTDGGDGFRFVWQEAGGHPVAAPTRRSFGSALLEMVLPGDFGGTAMLDFRPEGVRYELSGTVTKPTEQA